MRLVFCLKCARVTGRKRAANEQLRTGVQPHLQAFRVSAIADFGGQQKAAVTRYRVGYAVTRLKSGLWPGTLWPVCVWRE